MTMTKRSIFLSFNQQIAKYLPLWTQGAGSNLSEKETAEEMIIKASGFRLDQVNANSGYVKLNFKTLNLLLLNISNNPKMDQESLYSESLVQAKTDINSPLRPSMEAGFHALSKYKFVLHFHSLAAILMGEHLDWLNLKNINIIPLVNPGWELSKFFINNTAEMNILVNHGVILQSDSEGILEHWNHLEDDFLVKFKYTTLKSLKNKITASNQLMTKLDLAKFTSGPLKFYFPDMAIYFQKLKPFLIPTEKNNFKISEEASKDLFEVWTATQILYQSNPQLPELPEKMIEEITKLPTEKLRQNFIKG